MCNNRDGTSEGRVAHNVAVVVCDTRGGSTGVACAISRSVSGLRTTFSNVNRFRAETGGQFRIKTESSTRSWFFFIVYQEFLAPRDALASFFIDDPTRYSDGSCLFHEAGLCDQAQK